MMQGTIRRIPRHRVEPRADTRLRSAWIGSGQAASSPTRGSWLTQGASVTPTAHDGPVLVMLGPESAEALVDLAACATSGARVYALVGPDWGKENAEARLVQARGVLVRRLPEVPVTALHAGGSATLMLGGGFALRLDEPQTEALRQTFLRLFWHEATEEAWSGGRQFMWRPAPERPFDVPETPPSAPIRWERPDAGLTGECQGALVHLAAGPPPKAAPRRLWLPAGPDHHERLEKLARAGAEIVWSDRGLPDLLVAGDSGEALLPGERGRLRVRLVGGQAGEVGALLEGNGAWRFDTNVRLGDPGHRQALFWLPGEAEARGLEDEQPIPVPEVVASSLRAVPKTAPESVPAAQPLALAVRYDWTVVPPRLPGGAQEDALVGRWRRLDDDWTSRLARVREALLAADGDRGRITRAFSRLVSAMLGFERTHGGLMTRVAEMEAQRPSTAGPSAVPAMLAALKEVEERAKKLQVDLEEAEHKAHEDEERERQRAAWQNRVDNANRDLPARRAELVEAEAQQSSVAEELGALGATKPADKAAKKDLKARQRKLSDELERAKKAVSRKRGEIDALERQAAESFEFRPPARPPSRAGQTGGRFIPITPSAPSAPQVPDEALPEVGSLCSRKSQRYLVIQTWEELDAGERAASRLSATLVAPENV